MSDQEFKGTTAIVTGSGQGIGREIALALGRAGAAVVIADWNEDKAAAVVGEIKSSGGRAVAVRTDVSNQAQVEAMVARALDAFGRIDVLVNNAGIGHVEPFL